MNETTKIATWLEQVKFRKRLLGGVSEQDVWKKIEELHGLYLSALEAERLRYDALLAHRGEPRKYEGETHVPGEER